MNHLSHAVVREAVVRALGEDCGPCDITTQAVIDPSTKASAQVVAKQDGVFAGITVAQAVFHEADPTLAFTPLKADGDSFEKGAILAQVDGLARGILTGERVALNFMQRLSGIATLTAAYVRAVAHTRCHILDTRKTTPGLRALEKYAVRCGGGRNHRMGLYDEFMIKDNHIALGGGDLEQLIRRARAFDAKARLTVEAERLDQVERLIDLGVDRILLDNMSVQDMAQAVRMAGGRIETEASGNMTLERVPCVAETGVDFISVGALTHSAPAIDLSLQLRT